MRIMDRYETEVDRLQKKYMKSLGYYLLALLSAGAVFFLLYFTDAGKSWLENNIYLLFILLGIFLIGYLYIYFKYKRKIEKKMYE